MAKRYFDDDGVEDPPISELEEEVLIVLEHHEVPTPICDAIVKLLNDWEKVKDIEWRQQDDAAWEPPVSKEELDRQWIEGEGQHE